MAAKSNPFKWWADKAYGNEKVKLPKPNYPKLPPIDIGAVAKGTRTKTKKTSKSSIPKGKI